MEIKKIQNPSCFKLSIIVIRILQFESFDDQLWPKLVLKLMVNKFGTSFDEIKDQFFYYRYLSIEYIQSETVNLVATLLIVVSK